MAAYRRFSSINESIEEVINSKNTLPESDVYKEPWRALGSWFLGPRGENKEILKNLVAKCLDWYCDCRESYFPTDPSYITDNVKQSDAYQGEIKDLEKKLEKMHKDLTDSIPFFSNRYQGHMVWETTIPSTVGYFAGMLWNQNNVDSSASPVTTMYELTVGKHLCDLMNFDREDNEPWAHMTSCGSIANIEAMWAARNLKLHPLALKSALNDPEANDFKDGLNLQLSIPNHDDDVRLGDCTDWELLNLSVDDICSLNTNVLKLVGKDNDESKERLNDILKKHSVQSLGFLEFGKLHDIKTPVICASGTHHYSWPKGATVLGLGDNHVINIEVDLYARQNTKMLRDVLEKCANEHIPVMMVVAVIGSTEESAVDPLSDMLELREEFFCEKGLNFAIHADAAWGGYMLSMLTKPKAEFQKKRKDIGEDYVPFMGLSKYAEKQYRCVRFADTVTIDPHKTGFCHYPSGALAYRNGSMRHFISLKAAEIAHGDEKHAIGFFGLEGSKPGAAAASVLLSHQVIGLDQYGYGRILGQCQYGAVLFYCLWMSVAEDYDDFVCENMVNLPPISQEFPYDGKQAKAFIRKHIFGKSNEEIRKSEEAKNFIRQVGPDALINTFVVNMKGQKKTSDCNQLTQLIVDETSGSVGEHPKRIELFLTSSTFEQSHYGEALTNLKTRLGLNTEDRESLDFLRNTNMNPFQASDHFLVDTGFMFRNIVRNCIGAMTDIDDFYTFIVVNRLCKGDKKLFLEMIPSFAEKQQQYHVIMTMKLNNEQANTIRDFQESSQERIFLQTNKKVNLMKLLRQWHKSKFHIRKGSIKGDNIGEIELTRDEVIRYQHLETPEASAFISYPKHQQYFMYGDEYNVFISHVISRFPDFHQIVELDGIPKSIDLQLIDLGLVVTLPDLVGSPEMDNDCVVDPLIESSYCTHYTGNQGVESTTNIRFARSNGKLWFDGKILNDVA